MDVILKMKTRGTKNAKVVTCEVKVTQRPFIGEYINVADFTQTPKRDRLFLIIKIVHDPEKIIAWVADQEIAKDVQYYILNGWFLDREIA